jgi:hypothetical protein
MVSIPRSSDKNRCNRLFRLSLLSSATTRHTTSFRFNIRKYYNMFQSVLQTSSSFSYRTAQTLRPVSEPESGPGRTESVSVPAGKSYIKHCKPSRTTLFRKEKLFVSTLVTIRAKASDVTTCELTRQSQWERTCKRSNKFRIYAKNECEKLGSMGLRK